jgi:hypothetical protein
MCEQASNIDRFQEEPSKVNPEVVARKKRNPKLKFIKIWIASIVAFLLTVIFLCCNFIDQEKRLKEYKYFLQQNPLQKRAELKAGILAVTGQIQFAVKRLPCLRQVGFFSHNKSQ